MAAALNAQIDNAVATTSPQFISQPVLNAFFNRQVSRYLSSSGDLTTSRGFAILDNADDRLMVGLQMASNNNIAQPSRWVFSTGLKADVKSGFATVFKNGTARNNLGGVLKVTWIGHGIMRLGADADFAKRNEAYIKLITDEQAKKAKDAAADWAKELDSVDKSAQVAEEAGKQKKRKEAEYKKLLGDLARNAAQRIEEGGHYGGSHSWWFSVEGYAPFSPTEYYTVDSVAAGMWNTHELSAWQGKLSGTYLHTHSTCGTQFLTLWIGYLNNNNILSKQLTTTDASSNSSSAAGDTLNLVQLDGQSDVGIGPYARFDTYKLGGRAVFMLLPWMGASFEVEKWFGDYEPLNWKLGLPFSFRNDKGDRVVNFEVQWREQLDVHSLGISVGLPFGGSLYK